MRRKVYDGCVGGFVGVCPLPLLLPFMTISNFDKFLADELKLLAEQNVSMRSGNAAKALLSGSTWMSAILVISLLRA